MRARRFWAALGSVALVAGVAAPSSAAPSPSPLPVPTSMAALGDSITIAYDIKSLLRADPTYSWSTGTQSAVQSLYTRLEGRDSTPSLARVNHAVSGAKIGDLATQAGKVAGGTDLVTVLMGANDACTSTESGMTIRRGLQCPSRCGLGVLSSKRRRPDRGCLDPRHLQAVGGWFEVLIGTVRVGALQDLPVHAEEPHIVAPGRRRTAGHGSVLASSHSTPSSPRRCESKPRSRASSTTTPSTSTSFSLTDISKVDYFHPSVSGQAKLASVTYSAFGFPTG